MRIRYWKCFAAAPAGGVDAITSLQYLIEAAYRIEEGLPVPAHLDNALAWKVCFEACGVPADQIDKVATAFRHIDDISSAAVRRKLG